jgi:hypothetical protein
MMQANDDSASDVRHLLFLSQLFSRAADVVIGTKRLGHPLSMVGALREVLAGKLARAEMLPSDLEALPMLLCWLGAELMRVVF